MKKSISRALLSLILFFAVVGGAFAQLEDGKVYRFINRDGTSIALSANDKEAYGTTARPGKYSQLWLVEKHPWNDDSWGLRSLGNGKYLQNNGVSTPWTFNSTINETTPLYFIDLGDGFYTFNSKNNSSGSTCMHYATSQGGSVVGWNTNATATFWTYEEVEISAEDLEQNWKDLDEFNGVTNPTNIAAYETALANLFADKACTTLKKSFADEAAIEADADYQALPSPLKQMVKKVFTDDWSEPNYDENKPGWDSEYGKRFRVQSIEPYSVAGQITEWLAINAHINMDNPTGLFANSRQHLFIMVEGEIKAGSSLYLHSITGHSLMWNGTAGIQLHEGLNVVPFSGDGSALYLTYTVNTYSSNSTTNKFPHKLSDFDNLKVHIEGGNINGYYNAVGDHLWGEPDDDNDWLYYEERYNLQNITILGKHQILHYRAEENVPYTDSDGNQQNVKGMTYYCPERIKVPAGTPENQKINTMVEAWDRIHLSELVTMGLVSKETLDSLNKLYPGYDENWDKTFPIYTIDDKFYEFQGGRDYSEYFNHHGVAYGNFSGYMSGGWQNCNYHHNTMNAIIGEIAVGAGATWGPAHEIGHQHQAAMNLNGLTEVTNNLFSNVAVWYMGIGTSRFNGTEGNLAHVYDAYQTENSDFFTNNIWALTHMYYRLWLYYHRAGHNTQFFPRLYECLRNERMPRVGVTTGKETILRFYRHACVAAGEDLTEFFRAHGFFRVMVDRHVGDYANSDYTQPQSDIDEAIAWVKALGYKENYAPLFINDGVAERTYSHDGATVREYWDPQTANGQNATIGMYTDCINTLVPAEGYYYTRNGQAFEFLKQENANGAIGFMIYSGDELIAFTNNYKVTIPKSAREKVVEVYAVQADGRRVQLLSAAEAGTEDEQRAFLNASLSAAKPYYDAIMVNGDECGFYYPEYGKNLKEIYEGAKASYQNKDQSVRKYGQWSVMLDAAVANIINDPFSYMNIKDGNVYVLYNKARATYNLTYTEAGLKGTTEAEVALTDESKHWVFESAGAPNEWYIKNANGYYISYAYNGEQIKATTTNKKDASVFVSEHNTNGCYDIYLKKNTSLALSFEYDKTVNAVKGGAPAASKSRWELKIVEDNATAKEKAQLESLVERGDYVVDRICDVEKGNWDTDSLALRDYVTVLNEGLATAVEDLYAELGVADGIIEAGSDYVDFGRYVAGLQAALDSVYGKYVAITPAATEGVAWYYLRDTKDGLYAGLVEGCDSVQRTVRPAIGDDAGYRWALVNDGVSGEYRLYNAATGACLYKDNRHFMIANGAEGVAEQAFTITVDAENAGVLFKFNDASRYLNVSSNVYLKATAQKAYWVLEDVAFEAKDIVTGIEYVQSEDTKVDTGIYDLFGRKVQKVTENGIYIQNGKKVYIKK